MLNIKHYKFSFKSLSLPHTNYFCLLLLEAAVGCGVVGGRGGGGLVVGFLSLIRFRVSVF